MKAHRHRGGERRRPARRFCMLGAGAASLFFFAGCNVGPKYHKPTVETPSAYKEIGDWKIAEPKDETARGKWWEIFGDPRLNELEDQVNVSNQNIAAAAANFLVARAVVRQARSQYFPVVSVNPAITNQRQPVFGGFGGGSGSGSAVGGLTTGSFTEYSLPFDASWQPDLWGRVRKNVQANVYAAQALAADLENVRLTMQSEVAVDYFQIRSQDAQKQLLDDTVQTFQDSLDIVRARFQAGLSSNEDVVQAETQLETAQAQDTDLGIQRAQFEHAIAVLVGKPTAEFSMAALPMAAGPPAVPVEMPSALLERRPDIATAERTMARANTQIGIAQAAFYPTVTLSGGTGLQSTSLADWFTWPSRFWSVGPALAQTLFDAGARRAVQQQAQASYDQTVALYRQTVLAAFQQVEDNIAALRILEHEVQQQDAAIRSSQENLSLATDRYKAGIDIYLNILTAQTTLLSNQRTALNLRMEQMVDSVKLIEALGGGWNASQMPSPKDIADNVFPNKQSTASPRE
jgi:NodT family efflux transporter outer membrane factor (OMF) lipoprotein